MAQVNNFMKPPTSARGGNLSAQRIGLKNSLQGSGVRATGLPPKGKGGSLSALGKNHGVVQGASGYYLVSHKNNDLVPLAYS